MLNLKVAKAGLEFVYFQPPSVGNGVLILLTRLDEQEVMYTLDASVGQVSHMVGEKPQNAAGSVDLKAVKWQHALQKDEMSLSLLPSLKLGGTLGGGSPTSWTTRNTGRKGLSRSGCGTTWCQWWTAIGPRRWLPLLPHPIFHLECSFRLDAAPHWTPNASH